MVVSSASGTPRDIASVSGTPRDIASKVRSGVAIGEGVWSTMLLLNAAGVFSARTGGGSGAVGVILMFAL
jgi:hypothetical protein